MNATVEPAIPRAADLTKEQRSALLVDLIKAHFAEKGMPWFLSVRDGDKLLGIFHPEFQRPAKSTIPNFPPEFIEEMKRRAQEEKEGRATLFTTEEVLLLLDSEDGCKRLGL